MSLIKTATLQMGLENPVSQGTLVPATFKWQGKGTLDFTDVIATPEFDYYVGAHSGYVEGAFVAETGSKLSLADCDFGAEVAIWLFNMGIKALPGAASSFSFAFPVPGAAANSINTFTWEASDSQQEYEFGYGFCESFNVHGDVGADNGRVKVNAVILGQLAAASTLTGALSTLANITGLNINASKVFIGALGTAYATITAGAATSGLVKAVSLDCKTGWHPGSYADGRSGKDFSLAEYGGYEMTGRMRTLWNAAAVTQLANARAGTGVILVWQLNGASSRKVEFQLPIVYTKAPSIGDSETNGLRTVEFEFKVGDSRTSTAQSPVIAVTASGSTTVT